MCLLRVPSGAGYAHSFAYICYYHSLTVIHKHFLCAVDGIVQWMSCDIETVLKLLFNYFCVVICVHYPETYSG